MENKQLYPELADYIFEYCGRYFWEKEAITNKHLMHIAKIIPGNTAMYKAVQQAGWISVDPGILEMVKDGFEIYKKRVTERIFNEHFDELELNLCPKCSKIARTPWAQQCRFCHHDWH